MTTPTATNATAGTYPYRTRDVALPTGTVTITDEGAGPVLLFVHAGMWAYIWKDVVTRLRTDFRCITIDFPGYGLAPDSEGELGIPDLSAILEELVDTLAIDRLTLVLHDLGGPVGMGFAARHPEMVAGLVLANTFVWEPDTRGLRTMLRIMGSRPVTALGTATRIVPRMTATGMGVGRHLDAAGRAAFLAPFADRQRTRRFHRLIRSPLAEPEAFAEIAEAVNGPVGALPVLTIFGERNDPFGFQDRINGLFPNHAAGVVVENGNHFPMMDDPDLFASTLTEWHHAHIAEGR